MPKHSVTCTGLCMCTDMHACIGLLMAKVTVRFNFPKYSGYLSMSRNLFNFIVEGLQSSVPNPVVCEVNCLANIIPISLSCMMNLLFFGFWKCNSVFFKLTLTWFINFWWNCFESYAVQTFPVLTTQHVLWYILVTNHQFLWYSSFLPLGFLCEDLMGFYEDSWHSYTLCQSIKGSYYIIVICS